ncbi:MAG: tRNA (adenosine(37)-N6)-threonylcarbamoyltransferase complex ATPase subunit type 1 TsaE [Firmicutes bacterium]|nr:tRNA (adenosine(37)-N6)-threonylcarbamoyltransferase complex ATPase subunit type 1 TsaE [Eubacterium sp.]MBR3052691.1 tRNA (adenosine(37)-N6)-threonylcarbamoyltransferase complex ATPase subunit type 1 TsaE [Bacillota bacterium]MBR3211837.1 tRNA (adenosine(37)-N6)-threonylcarbamoyltransferase complex ATPase subunit type 1 TsaE [Bacillota bacterium]MCR4669127.1 tRNA (adenosine(37)-N6)-threonylcarbamoyltransferase complex ATPase subunit type 1 TsaE [Clostridia bacterium]
MRGTEETERFGLELAGELKAGDVIALTGDLGAGKTTLAKSIAKGLGVRENVTSPTFTIVCEYMSGRLPLFHFDLYRIGSEEEAFEAGLEEYFSRGGVSVIEWAERVPGLIPDDARVIVLEYGEKEDERILSCSF